MNYWLMKTEPDTYSWNDLVRDTAKKGAEEWTGVRNYQARNMMRQMTQGDKVFVYHSGKERAVVGIATVVNSAHSDSTDSSGTWECVDIASVSKLTNPVTLGDIKRVPALKDMVLVNNSRLSVQPVREEEWKKIVEMSGA